MSRNKDVLIKLTRDGRLWAMGLVVNTVDEALARCEQKAPGRNIHVEWPDMVAGKWNMTAGVCGPAEYIRAFLCA